VADKAVQIDNASDLMDVFQVWTKNPLTDRNAILLEFQLINGYIVLSADSSADSVFIVGNQVPASDYGDATTDLPAFLERYLLLACVADFYKADGQLEKSVQQEQMAEETLALELDRVERLNSMNKITINSYPSYSFGVSILSTT
jgi:4-diphosphocytidyl-2C-methyl-D-erythritol kinase